jgi:hypothetical protein
MMFKANRLFVGTIYVGKDFKEKVLTVYSFGKDEFRYLDFGEYLRMHPDNSFGANIGAIITTEKKYKDEEGIRQGNKHLLQLGFPRASVYLESSDDKMVRIYKTERKSAPWKFIGGIEIAGAVIK